MGTTFLWDKALLTMMINQHWIDTLSYTQNIELLTKLHDANIILHNSKNIINILKTRVYKLIEIRLNMQPGKMISGD